MTTRKKARGYKFEHDLKQFVNGDKLTKEEKEKWNWKCRIFGGSSTGFPDLVMTNNKSQIMYAVECKSTANDKTVTIPLDQIERCQTMLDFFGLYKFQAVVFASKFSSKRSIKTVRHYKTKKGKIVERKVTNTRTKPIYWFFVLKDIKTLKGIKSVTIYDSGKIFINWSQVEGLEEYNIGTPQFENYFDTERYSDIQNVLNHFWTIKLCDKIIE